MLDKTQKRIFDRLDQLDRAHSDSITKLEADFEAFKVGQAQSQAQAKSELMGGPGWYSGQSRRLLRKGTPDRIPDKAKSKTEGQRKTSQE